MHQKFCKIFFILPSYFPKKYANLVVNVVCIAKHIPLNTTIDQLRLSNIMKIAL